MSLRKIYKHVQISSPRKNLPLHIARKRTESNFVLAFARTFVNSIGDSVILTARDLPVKSFGIADFVCLVQPKATRTDEIQLKPRRAKVTFLAFEIKIKDWRSALSQAFNYKYFANTSIVVLPPKDAENAKAFLKTFHLMNIGLWVFDEKQKNIKQIFTPSHKRPIYPSAHQKALDMLSPMLQTRVPHFV